MHACGSSYDIAQDAPCVPWHRDQSRAVGKMALFEHGEVAAEMHATDLQTWSSNESRAKLSLATLHIADINNIIKQLSDELIKGTFMARVEVNSKIGSNSRTYTIIEYHDSTTGVHSIDMAPLNIRKMYFANLATKTFVTVNKLGE